MHSLLQLKHSTSSPLIPRIERRLEILKEYPNACVLLNPLSTPQFGQKSLK
jgi:hypothetical protein